VGTAAHANQGAAELKNADVHGSITNQVAPGGVNLALGSRQPNRGQHGGNCC